MEVSVKELNSEWLSVVLEEYKTLRTESLQAMNNQLSILQVGTGAVGVVIATGFGLWNTDDTLIAIVMFLFLSPLVCYLSLIVWIGEVQRMMRVGFYISELEIKINNSFPDMPPVLNWENYLRTKNGSKTPQMIWNYISVIFMFFAIAVICIVIGSLKTKADYQTSFNIYMIISTVLFAVIGTYIIILCLNLRRS